MRVALVKDIPNLGKIGDIKDVRDGYGRNFLIRNKLAEILTPKIEQELKLAKEKKEKASVKLKKLIELSKEKIESLNLVFKIKVGKSGEAFGSVTPLKIKSELKKQGIDLEKEQILTKPIRTLGTSKVTIKLSKDIETYLTVFIEPEK